MVMLVRFSACLMTLVLVAPAAAASPPETNTVTINGMEMHYEVVGEGEPLLLLHSGTQSGAMWSSFVPEWSRHYRLIIPDLRGHGGSNNPDGLWTTRQFADDVFALLDTLGIDGFRAVGASIGAMTLLQMAITRPARIEKLVVIGTGTYLPVECREILAKTDASTLSEASWARLRTRHRNGDDQIRALYAWVRALATSYNDLVFTPPMLATITAPTLVVHGDRDYCFPASMALDIYSAIPDAYLWVVPNGDHVPISESTAPHISTNVLDFLGGGWD